MGIQLDLRKVSYLVEGLAYQELFRKGGEYYSEICEDARIGFTDLPENLTYVDQSDHVLDQLPGGIDTLYVLGIGGSALGTSMLLDAFSDKHKRRVVVVDNIDDHSGRVGFFINLKLR